MAKVNLCVAVIIWQGDASTNIKSVSSVGKVVTIKKSRFLITLCVPDDTYLPVSAASKCIICGV